MVLFIRFGRDRRKKNSAELPMNFQFLNQIFFVVVYILKLTRWFNSSCGCSTSKQFREAVETLREVRINLLLYKIFTCLCYCVNLSFHTKDLINLMVNTILYDKVLLTYL